MKLIKLYVFKDVGEWNCLKGYFLVEGIKLIMLALLGVGNETD